MNHRVAVIPIGFGLGDTVNMRPLLDAIVRARPNSRISALCPANYASLLPAGVQAVHSIGGVPLWQRPDRNSLVARALQTISARSAGPIVRRLAAERWSARLSILLRGQGFDEVFNLLEGLSALDLDRRWSPGPWSSPGGHVIDEMATFLQARGVEVPLDGRKPILTRPPRGAWTPPPIVLNPNAGSSLKEVPADLWIAIARELVGAGHPLLVLRGLHGGMSEEVCARVLGTRLIATPGIESLVQLVSSSALLISLDTGVLHLAAALGVPYLGLFGSTDPHFLGPYGASPDDIVLSRARHAAVCQGCWAAQLLPRAACAMAYDPNCLSHIQLDDVLPRVRAKLSAPSCDPRGEGTVTAVRHTGSL